MFLCTWSMPRSHWERLPGFFPRSGGLVLRSRGDPEFFVLLKIPTPTMTCSHINYDMTQFPSARGDPLHTTTSHPSLRLSLSLHVSREQPQGPLFETGLGQPTHSSECELCESPRLPGLCIDKTRKPKRQVSRMPIPNSALLSAGEKPTTPPNTPNMK